MNRRFAIVILSSTAIALVLATACSEQPTEVPKAGDDLAISTHESIAIEWASDWDSAFVKARSTEKPVMAVFYADWCIWCKRLDNTTLLDTGVASFVADNVVPVRLDIDAAGKELSREFRVQGPPTIIVFSAQGTEIGRIPGYLPPDGFLQRVKTIL
jgi:thiol:disulfide interchange protein